MARITVDRTTWTERARTFTFFVLALSVALLVALVLTAGLAHADTTFTVDRSDDPDLDTTPTADDCAAATANDCSLRGAITAANNTLGTDTIDFAIPEDPGTPADDVKTIQVDGDETTSSINLPDIAEAVTIDGYTQPGASPNTKRKVAQGTDAKLHIVLNGGSLGALGIGLTISASDVVVKGLAINCFATGIFIPSTGSRAVIRGNFIGGEPSLCTANNGVNVFGSDNIFGGPSPAARNVISGNLVRGLSIAGNGGNTIQGNLIGTRANGTDPLGNGLEGVQISSPNNTVGGIDSDPTDTNNPANLIAFNGGDGVIVNGGRDNAFAVRNRILSNSIFSNGDLGIDLDGGTDPSSSDGDGATPNDAKDTDTGPNTLQNKPVLDSAITAGGSTTIAGRLNSTPNKSFTIQLFSDPSGNEGKRLIRQKLVTTNANGNTGTFTFNLARAMTVGDAVTATATGSANTSEFSGARIVSSS